jgi:Protein of unknown function (DUF2586)
MNNVIINRGQGGLGRQPLGQDFISGFVFYGTAPSGWPGNVTGGGVVKMGGLSDALAAGITNTHSGETAATALLTMSTAGSAGLILNIYIQEPSELVLVATYTTVSGDTSANTYATNITSAINANTFQNGGYTATSSTDVVTLKARPGLGAFLNSGTPLSVTGTASGDATLKQFGLIGTTAGVYSSIDIWYYHISRFFTQSPNATLYVGIFNESPGSGYAFPEVGYIQNFTNGAIRQLGVYVQTPFGSLSQTFGYITAMQAQVNTLISINSPVSVIVGTDFTELSASALTTLAGLNSEHVSICIGQDGAAQGAALFVISGISITQLGDVLGLVAASQVSDDIAWVATYTLSPDGIENAVPALATCASGIPQLLSTLSTGTIDAIDANRYIFGRQFVNDSPSGTYVNDSHCCTSYTSDYAYIENNRTFDKASRQLYAAYIEQLAAPLTLNADGTLTSSTVAFFEGLGEQALSNMAQTNPNTGRPELSGFSVTINPAQNVLSTSTLVVTVLLQPVGVAREIVINLQFAVSL